MQLFSKVGGKHLAGYVLHDEKKLFLCFDYVKNLDDVGMVKFLKSVNFANHAFAPLSVHQSKLFVNFDSKHHGGCLVSGLLYRGIRTRAQMSPNSVLRHACEVGGIKLVDILLSCDELVSFHNSIRFGFNW
jgi:hypothetical protein